MTTLLLSLVLMLLAFAGLAIGVIMGRKPIQGSCGGLNQLGEKGACELCGGKPENCEQTVSGSR